MPPIKFVAGVSNTQKFDSVEKALRSFSRRLFKTTVLMTPPVPLFSEGIDPDGVIFRGFIPFRGKLDRIAIFVGKFITRPVSVEVQLMDNVGSSAVTFPLSNMITVHQLDMPVSQPCILQVRATSIGAIEQVLFSALTYPETDRILKEQFVIDALLQNFEATELLDTGEATEGEILE